MKNSNGEREEDEEEEERSSHVRGTGDDEDLVQVDSVHAVTIRVETKQLLFDQVILV